MWYRVHMIPSPIRNQNVFTGNVKRWQKGYKQATVMNRGKRIGTYDG